MNTTNKVLIGLGVVLVFFLAFSLWSVSNSLNSLSKAAVFGATTSSYNSALQQISLYNWQVDVVNSLSALRAGLNGNTANTSTLIVGVLSPAASCCTANTTTTTLTVPGAQVGDTVLPNWSTSTAGVYPFGTVTSSGTVKVTFFNMSNATSTATGTSTLTVYSIPATNGLGAPAAISVTTSSAPYNP